MASVVGELVLVFFFEILCVVSGFGASTIAFTAFIVIVPYMLNIANFNLFGTLFLTLWIDLVSSVFLIIRYSFTGDIKCYKFCLLGLIEFPISFGASLYLSDYILNKFSFLLKGAGSYALFLLSVMYFLRFFVNCGLDIKQRKQSRRKKDMNIEENVVQSVIYENSHIKSDFSGNINQIDGETESLIPNNDSKDESDEGIINCEKDDIADISSSSSQSEIVEAKATNKKFQCFYRIKNGYEVFTSSSQPCIWFIRNSIFLLTCIILSLAAGIIKISGGTANMVCLRNLYNFSLLQSTATGIFLSFWLIIGSLIGLIHQHPHEVFRSEVVEYSAIAFFCAIVGCILGSSVMVMLQDYMAFLFIAITFLGLGLASVIVKCFS